MHVLISKPSVTILHTSSLPSLDDYFVRHLSLSPEDALVLHQQYYKDYGLAVSGLALHHKIDPLNFNREVDDALPLDTVLSPNPHLRNLLEDFDKSKVKLWLFTNAHITHARRVIRLLGLKDLFEGATYCDYSKMPLVCKPHKEMYDKAEAEAGAASSAACFFVGKEVIFSMSGVCFLTMFFTNTATQMTRTSIVVMRTLGVGQQRICLSQGTQSLRLGLPHIRFEISTSFAVYFHNSSSLTVTLRMKVKYQSFLSCE